MDPSVFDVTRANDGETTLSSHPVESASGTEVEIEFVPVTRGYLNSYDAWPSDTPEDFDVFNQEAFRTFFAVHLRDPDLRDPEVGVPDHLLDDECPVSDEFDPEKGYVPEDFDENWPIGKRKDIFLATLRGSGAHGMADALEEGLGAIDPEELSDPGN